jgi:hypothetical protein
MQWMVIVHIVIVIFKLAYHAINVQLKKYQANTIPKI